MQTLLWASLIFGLLIQRSSSRLLVEQCGNAVSTRISNGQNAEPEAAAWMAAVGNDTQFICGGTVIHKRFVLTAAHCIKNQGRLLVALGAYNLLRPVVQYTVSISEIHRGYSEETARNDIGLLQLPIDIVFNAQIYPICIDLHSSMKRHVENADTFDAYGWGRTQAGDISKILQRVTLDHYDPSRCNRIARAPLTSNQICAGSSNRDTCKGDSGGPLIKEFEYNGIRRLTQIGMVSYGLTSCKGLGIYTDVTSYADWIEEKINAQFPEDSWKPSPIVRNFDNVSKPVSFDPPTQPVVSGLMHQLTDMRKRAFPERSWQLSPTANPDSISPPTETVSYGVENFGQARLLVEPCGTSLSTRIMGGNNAEPEAAAWMAGVYNEEGFRCGSTLIHRRFALSSASCIRTHEDLFVKLGAYDLRRPTGEYIVTKKIIHDEYNTKTHINNIALLQLSRDIQFSWRVYPICIILNPEVKDKVENAYTFDAYGWGTTNETRISNLLQKVTLDLYNRSECNKVLRVPLLSCHICAGASVGNTCDGDLGGPLTKKVIVNGLQRQTQFGITSSGSPLCQGISVYTDVTSYVDWIVQNVRWSNYISNIMINRNKEGS